MYGSEVRLICWFFFFDAALLLLLVLLSLCCSLQKQLFVLLSSEIVVFYSSVLAYLQKLLPQIDYSTLTTFLAASHDHHFNGFCLDSILSSAAAARFRFFCDCMMLPGELQTRLDYFLCVFDRRSSLFWNY